MKKSIKKFLITALAVCVMLCASLTLLSGANRVKADDSLNSFRMLKGASLRLSSDSHGLRFLALMDKTLADEVVADETKSFGMVIVPMDVLNRYSITGNYMEQLNNNGFSDDKLCLINDLTAHNHEDYGWCVSGAIIGIRYNNIDRDFVGIGFIKTVTAEGSVVSYEYAQSNLSAIARNSAEVASYAFTDLNKQYTAEQREVMNTYIEKATMRAMNKTEEEYASAHENGTMPEVGATLSQAKVNSSVGKTFKNEIVYTANEQTVNFDFPASYATSDSSVATVDKFGNVTMKKVGEATITVNTVSENLSYKVTAETTLLDKSESATYSLAQYSSVSVISKRTGQSVTVPENKVLDLTAYPEGVYSVSFTDNNGQEFVDEIDIYDSEKPFEWENGTWADSQYAYRVTYMNKDSTVITEAQFTNTDGKVSITTLSDGSDYYYNFYVKPRHSKAYYQLFADTTNNLVYKFGVKGSKNEGTNAYFYSDYGSGKYANATESFALKNSGQLWNSDTTWTNFGVTYASWLNNFDKWASGEYTYLRFEPGNGRINANASIFILPATITANA